MVEGNEYIGGILGYGYDDIMIINCANFGDITNLNNGTENYCGGIIGTVRSTTIINCSNERNTIISGGSATGGIVGYQFSSAGNVKIYNSYNLGSVIGNVNAGGIIGYVYSIVQCRNVYSAGNITGEIIDVFNTYIDNYREIDTSEWKKWNLSNPIFE